MRTLWTYRPRRCPAGSSGASTAKIQLRGPLARPHGRPLDRPLATRRGAPMPGVFGGLVRTERQLRGPTCSPSPSWSAWSIPLRGGLASSKQASCLPPLAPQGPGGAGTLWRRRRGSGGRIPGWHRPRRGRQSRSARSGVLRGIGRGCMYQKTQPPRRQRALPSRLPSTRATALARTALLQRDLGRRAPSAGPLLPCQGARFATPILGSAVRARAAPACISRLALEPPPLCTQTLGKFPRGLPAGSSTRVLESTAARARAALGTSSRLGMGFKAEAGLGRTPPRTAASISTKCRCSKPTVPRWSHTATRPTSFRRWRRAATCSM
mmetsp:Transcript_35889/g.91710  ORF Transcript_35889/g.91710 Transcript_35889/m.91710 type:complete len:324 (-) Transcript_35889:886-1857(-)